MLWKEYQEKFAFQFSTLMKCIIETYMFSHFPNKQKEEVCSLLQLNRTLFLIVYMTRKQSSISYTGENTCNHDPGAGPITIVILIKLLQYKMSRT
ncbi:hypothetical protein QD47_18895 [Paenibacillus terrae]|uniref:Uncharacterized protein n=1 Tax=Paenibacillus terrae TaxID=159743 RepID=A0A0D7WY00_9BACL|nr:hypothetical protein QD47_18895 [Paenibacillus terrae]